MEKKLPGIKPLYTDPADLERKVEDYFLKCETSKREYQLKSGDIKIRQEYPTVSGLALYLGMSYQTFNDYSNGNVSDKQIDNIAIKQMSDILARAKVRICQALENSSLTGDAEPRTVNSILARVQGAVETNIHVVVDGAGSDYSV